jgi:hypothetical protein
MDTNAMSDSFAIAQFVFISVHSGFSFGSFDCDSDPDSDPEVEGGVDYAPPGQAAAFQNNTVTE